MVSIKKMKLKKPNFLGKKSPKKKDEIDDEPSTPTVEITLVENDPIMEDREDAAEETSTASVEEDRNHLDDNEERSPPTEEVVEEEESEVIKTTEDESVITETNDADDALSTVKEEPSKEEAEEKATEEPTLAAEKEQEGASLEHTMDDEDLTLDATATSTIHDAGCTTPVHTSAFCGCF